MKKVYETAQINVVMFDTKDIVVASGIITPAEPTTTYFRENDETEILF